MSTLASLSALVSDVLSIAGIPGGAFLEDVTKRLIDRRIKQAREILLEEIRRGEKHISQAGDEDEFAAILFRYQRAAIEGTARLNLRLLAAVAAGQGARTGFAADEFLAWADVLATLRREELIHRTQQAIEKNIEQFYVFEVDENIIACVTLYFYPDSPRVAEVGSLYVMPFYHNRGIGRKMVEYAGMVAKERGADTLLALSTQNFGFFTNVCGFEEASKEALPEARLRTYDESGRNAKVLRKPL